MARSFDLSPAQAEAAARMKNLLSVEHNFNLYIAHVFKGVPIGPQQILELKKAWFGGIGWLLKTQLAVIASLPDDAAVVATEGMVKQIDAFVASLLDNGQGGPTNEPVATSVITKEK